MLICLVVVTALISVGKAMGVSFIPPARWAPVGAWVRANRLIFTAICLTVAVLAVVATTFAVSVAGVAPPKMNKQ